MRKNEKKDLRTGMAVRLRNDGLYYVMLNVDVAGVNDRQREILIQREGEFMGWIPLGRYDDDMHYHSDPNDFLAVFDTDNDWDIVEVCNCAHCVELFNIEKYETIWKSGEEK